MRAAAVEAMAASSSRAGERPGISFFFKTCFCKVFLFFCSKDSKGFPRVSRGFLGFPDSFLMFSWGSWSSFGVLFLGNLEKTIAVARRRACLLGSCRPTGRARKHKSPLGAVDGWMERIGMTVGFLGFPWCISGSFVRYLWRVVGVVPTCGQLNQDAGVFLWVFVFPLNHPFSTQRNKHFSLVRLLGYSSFLDLFFFWVATYHLQTGNALQDGPLGTYSSV